MTRKEAKEFLLGECKIINTFSWSDDRNAYDVPTYVLSDSKALKLIDQIYNYNEAQLKAKDTAIELLENMCNLGLETQNKYSRIVKAKDEEIERLKEMIEEALQNIETYETLLDGYKLMLKGTK